MKKDILAEAIGRLDEKYIDRAAESLGSGKGGNVIEVSFSGRPAPIKKRSKAEKFLVGAAGIAAAFGVIAGTVFFADFVSKNKVQTGAGKESSQSIACVPEFTEDYKAGVCFEEADNVTLSGGNIYNGGELFYVNNTSTDTNVQDIAVYDSRGFYLDTYTNLHSSLECEKNESYYFRMFFTERGPIGIRCSVTKSGEEYYSSARRIYFYDDKFKITGTADIPAYENEGRFEGYYLWSFSENGKYFVEAVMNTAEGHKYSLRAFSLENGAKLLFEIPDTREIPCVDEKGEEYIFNQFVALNISNDGKTIQTFNNELIDGGSQLSYFSVGYIDISGKEPTAKIAGFCGGTSGVIFDEADSITHVDGNKVDYYAFGEIQHINLPLSENEKAVTASLSPDGNYLAASVTNTETGKSYVRAFKGEGEDKELIFEQPCDLLPTRVEVNNEGTIISVDSAGNRSVYYAEMTRADIEGTVTSLFIRQTEEIPESVLAKTTSSVTDYNGSFYVLGGKMTNGSSDLEYMDVIKYDSEGNCLDWYRAELPEESDISDYWLYPAGDKLIMLEEGYSEGNPCCFVRYYDEGLKLISKHLLPINSDLDYIGGMVTNNGRYFIDERVDKEQNTVLLSVYSLENKPCLVTELNLSFEGRSIEQMISAFISDDVKTLIGETREKSGKYFAFSCNMETGELIDTETIDIMANGGYFSYYDNGLVECGDGIMQFRDENGSIKYKVADNGEELNGWAVSPNGRYILTTFGSPESGYKIFLYDREKAVMKEDSEIFTLSEPEKTVEISNFSYVKLNNSGTICFITNNGPVFNK